MVITDGHHSMVITESPTAGAAAVPWHYCIESASASSRHVASRHVASRQLSSRLNARASRQSRHVTLSQVRLAIERLGLSSVANFDPKTRIIEYVVGSAKEEPLAAMSVRKFVRTLGARVAAPGGGSASALIASMGAGLGAMVGWMTYGNRKFEELDPAMRR